MTQGRYRSLDDPETLRFFVRNLHEGVYITNDAGEILDANPACLEILGFASLAELRSHRAQDLFADPAQRDDTVADFRTLLAETAQSPAVLSALSLAGDGLLQLTRVSN